MNLLIIHVERFRATTGEQILELAVGLNSLTIGLFVLYY